MVGRDDNDKTTNDGERITIRKLETIFLFFKSNNITTKGYNRAIKPLSLFLSLIYIREEENFQNISFYCFIVVFVLAKI